MADISVYKYWKVGVNSVGEYAVININDEWSSRLGKFWQPL